MIGRVNMLSYTDVAVLSSKTDPLAAVDLTVKIFILLFVYYIIYFCCRSFTHRQDLGGGKRRAHYNRPGRINELIRVVHAVIWDHVITLGGCDP